MLLVVEERHQLQHDRRELAVDELLRLRVGVGREVRAEDLPDDVDEPRELALALREAQLQLRVPRPLGRRLREALLVAQRRRLEERDDVGRDLLQLEAAERRQRVELLGELLVVLERVVGVGALPRAQQVADELHPRVDERGDHLRHVALEVRRRLALEVRHRGDEARPEREEVVDGVGGPLPVLERVDREVGHHRDPLGVVAALHELRELKVGLEPREQPAELVIVLVVGEARLALEHAERPLIMRSKKLCRSSSDEKSDRRSEPRLTSTSSASFALGPPPWELV